MTIGRRTLLLLAGVAVVGAPALLLRSLCLGSACDDSNGASATVPFCSLPTALRSRIVDGFRDGRSPDVFAVTGEIHVTSDAILGGAWPSVENTAPERVPIVFWGPGIEPGSLDDGTRLDAIAPTVADLIGLDRPHPDVRSGRALEGVVLSTRPRVVIVVAYKGVGSDDLEADTGSWPYLQRLVEEGQSTLAGDPGSLPIDPAALLTTVGTGGLPRQHGITAQSVRNDHGRLVEAWSKNAPVSVIATLADDLDELHGQAPLIGLVATDRSDRGLVGGNWYVDVDRDEIVVERESPDRAARAMLSAGFGKDVTPDFIGLAVEGPVELLDGVLRRVVESARARFRSVAVVVTGTGSEAVDSTTSVTEAEVIADVEEAVNAPDPVIEAAVPGGLFLDQDVLATHGIAQDDILRALRDIRGPGGEPLFADAFSGTAVSFARYC